MLAHARVGDLDTRAVYCELARLIEGRACVLRIGEGDEGKTARKCANDRKFIISMSEWGTDFPKRGFFFCLLVE